MICRVWRGWTLPGNADAYEAVVRGQVIPAIEARGVPGFRHIDLMRRDGDEDGAGGDRETEFATIMWFDDMDAVAAFAGPDAHAAHVPAAARAVLARWDERAAHYEVLDRRAQG